jgi:hypothetical protein
MSKAGATGIPQFNFYKSAESPDKINSNALITMISHRVKDFPSWEAVHKTTEDLRRKAGITDDLLLQSLSDEHIVTVLSSATSLSGFNKYTSTLPTYWNATHLDPNSKGAKIQSEVVTEPEIKVLF